MKYNKSEKPSWPPETFAPLGPPVRILARGDDTQVRLQWMPTIGADGGLDVRLHRKSPSENDGLEAYSPTAAGLVIPRGHIREFIGLLTELAAEIER